MHIAILDDYQDAVRRLDCFKMLTGAGHQVTVWNDTVANVEQLARRLDGAEAVVLIRERTAVGAALLAHLPALKLISQTGKISNHLDIGACTARRVAVAEGVGSPVAPAELCWALVLAASRRIPQYSADLHRGRWQQAGSLGLGRVLKGRTLGIWGYGKIGRIIAGYGKAFGMPVIVWGRNASLEAAVADGHAAAASKADFFARADVISLHLRLNDATRACVMHADLASMKTDALFVNTSRAELVAPGALEKALAEGRPGQAALDVFEHEPVLDPDHPLLRMENVVCTPHLGYVEQASYELYFGKAFENILAFAAGQPQNIANPEALA